MYGIIVLVDHLSQALEWGEPVVGLFFDFSKAFDMADDDILSCMLEHYGIK